MKAMKKALCIIMAVLMLVSVGAFSASADECNHNYDPEYVKADCVNNGYWLYTCSECGYIFTLDEEDDVARGHRYGEWVTVNEAECEIEGHMQRICSVCNSVDTKTISPTGHIDADENGQCDVCFTAVEVDFKISPYDWLIALFRAIAQFFRDIFA